MAQPKDSSQTPPRKFSLSWKQIVTVVGALGYVASPVDLFSEAVLGPLGLGDDAVAVVIAAVTLFSAVRKFRSGRPQPGASGGGAAGGETPGRTPGGKGSAGHRVVVDPEDPTPGPSRKPHAR
ncbi:DUF1232 domain-containing protein [Antribacter sp. KLBMP9083]|uniref:DUF1232 domain-containing protein n=1 Tax=Antribacter soli TaxID=2910976 RepID=A0AA41QG59_9MICO|nr:YkvA family protein [Antribacter soli]MCF4122853.1 DUF1232 domain-containing protein [Antribacter soli]